MPQVKPRQYPFTGYLSLAIFFISLLVLLGCATLSVAPHFVGTYTGKNSDSLTILPDSRVYLNRQEQRIMLGYSAAVSGDPPGTLSIFGPDTSPYIGTTLEFTDDFKGVTVRWGPFIDTNDTSNQSDLFLKK